MAFGTGWVRGSWWCLGSKAAVGMDVLLGLFCRPQAGGPFQGRSAGLLPGCFSRLGRSSCCFLLYNVRFYYSSNITTSEQKKKQPLKKTQPKNPEGTGLFGGAPFNSHVMLFPTPKVTWLMKGILANGHCVWLIKEAFSRGAVDRCKRMCSWADREDDRREGTP